MKIDVIGLLNEIAKNGSFSYTKESDPRKLEAMRMLEAYGLVVLIGMNKYRLSKEGYIVREKGEFEIFDNKVAMSNKNDIRKIFISHSSLDYRIVEQVIELLEGIGTPPDSIFCSSFEGYSIGLGDDFLKTIKDELNSNVLVLFILSSNFYRSPVSLCEMGATWVRTSEHVPILIPPFDYKDIRGVIPNSHGMKVNEKLKMNELKEKVEGFLQLKSRNLSSWERKRDSILEKIDEIINSKPDLTENIFKAESENEIGLQQLLFGKWKYITRKDNGSIIKVIHSGDGCPDFKADYIEFTTNNRYIQFAYLDCQEELNTDFLYKIEGKKIMVSYEEKNEPAFDSEIIAISAKTLILRTKSGNKVLEEGFSKVED